MAGIELLFPINEVGIGELINEGFAEIFTGFIDKFVGDGASSFVVNASGVTELIAGEFTTVVIRGGGDTELPLRIFVDKFVAYKDERIFLINYSMNFNIGQFYCSLQRH